MEASQVTTFRSAR